MHELTADQIQANRRSLFYRLNWAVLLLTFGVIVLGAFVRLSDAGLGCPDWPGCYGDITVPAQAHAKAEYPNRPLVPAKAWKEMTHRYFAGTLGLLILALALLGSLRRRAPGQQVVLPWLLVALVIFQALLGMWTVTWQLKPLAVTGHLLGGMSLLALVVLCLLRQGGHLRRLTAYRPRGLRGLATALLVVLAVQLFLGAWTSSNYAALACPDFPTCQGQWWPKTDYHDAYVLWRGLNVNYEYGVLDSVPRATIHWTHRLFALVVVLFAAIVASMLLCAPAARARWLGVALLGAVSLQATLGITTVLLHLPLAVAVGHNAGAALLTLTVMTVNHTAWNST